MSLGSRTFAVHLGEAADVSRTVARHRFGSCFSIPSRFLRPRWRSHSVYAVGGGRQGIDLQEIGLRILHSRDPEVKATLTRQTWKQLETLPSTHSTQETERLLRDTDGGSVVTAEEREILYRVRYSDFDEEKTNGLDSLVDENRWEDIISRYDDTRRNHIPKFPGRPTKPNLVKANEFKRPRVPLAVYILHSLAHIELNAIDLYWDTIVRFYGLKELPTQMFVDLLDIARDEARHYMWLTSRLREHGSYYGDLPAHQGLWEDCLKTKEDLRARLAIVPLVQEAKALDSAPRLAGKLLSVGDHSSSAVLEQIGNEEVGHVYKGLRWFTSFCHKHDEEPISKFHQLVRKHHDSPLQGPFNDVARSLANMTPEWYIPLSRKPKQQRVADNIKKTSRCQVVYGD
eukprot:gb/GECG01004011.1/.p1 GENE.gb/GECG01004011.1/~~gb/GECG01004011.1/.p1  ORF type:complete len:400 (+),score=32.03 gb/GECG01004011.1/:1-1200(+)